MACDTRHCRAATIRKAEGKEKKELPAKKVRKKFAAFFLTFLVPAAHEQMG